MSPRSNRRQFLTGESLAAARPHSVIEDPVPAATAGQPLSWISRQAMACDFCVMLNTGQFRQATEHAVDVLERLVGIEQQLSLFRPESELNRVNRLASEAPVPVTDSLFQLLEQACRIHAVTRGAFDITASPLWRLWHFHRRQGRVPPEREIQDVLQRVGTEFLRLDRPSQSVQFLRPEMEINLGGIGKGFALDQMAAGLEAHGLTSFLIHGGHSSIVARGSRWPHTDQPWRINIPHPWRRGESIAGIELQNEALATSGAMQQSFHAGGRRFGHIIDPRRGWPAEVVITATVACRSAAEADAMATAMYVLGVDGAREICDHLPNVRAWIVVPGDSTSSCELVTIGSN